MYCSFLYISVMSKSQGGLEVASRDAPKGNSTGCHTHLPVLDGLANAGAGREVLETGIDERHLRARDSAQHAHLVHIAQVPNAEHLAGHLCGGAQEPGEAQISSPKLMQPLQLALHW